MFENLRILFVDDSCDEVDLFVARFSRSGVEIATAETVTQALDTVRWFEPDILVSDLYLSEATGLDLVTMLRDGACPRLERTPAIAATGASSADLQTSMY